MKANQSFSKADEAVSPVIGVILMVAITVVLAAVVFVLVNDLGSGADSAPTMGFSADEGDDRLNVDKAPQGTVPWSDMALGVQGSSVTICAQLNGAPDNATTTTCNTFTTANFTSTNAIAGGDYLEFCSANGQLSDVTIVLTHTPSGQVVKRTDFASIAAC